MPRHTSHSSEFPFFAVCSNWKGICLDFTTVDNEIMCLSSYTGPCSAGSVMRDWWSEDQGWSPVKTTPVSSQKALAASCGQPWSFPLGLGGLWLAVTSPQAILESKATPAASKERVMQAALYKGLFLTVQEIFFWHFSVYQESLLIVIVNMYRRCTCKQMPQVIAAVEVTASPLAPQKVRGRISLWCSPV